MNEQTENVVLLEGPLAQSLPGRDVIAWKWNINGHEVVVEISQTAYEISGDPDALSERVANAIRSQGRSEVERMLDWDVPNDRILLTTDSE